MRSSLPGSQLCHRPARLSDRWNHHLGLATVERSRNPIDVGPPASQNHESDRVPEVPPK